VLIFFFASYLAVMFLDAVLSKFVLTNINVESGVTKITLKHFTHHPENVFYPHYFNKFLNNIVQGKRGVFSYKSFYVTIFLLYLFFIIGLSLELINGALKECNLGQKYAKTKDFILHILNSLNIFQKYFITKNNFSVFFARISNAFLQLVLISFISRILGKEPFGVFSFITTVAFITLNLANVGLDTLMIRTTAGNVHGARQNLSNTLGVKLFTSCFITLSVAMLFIVLWGRDAIITKAFLLYSTSIIFGALTHTLWHFGDCFERLEYHSFLWTTSNLLKAVVGIMAVFFSKKLEILFISLLFSEIISFGVSFWMVRKAFGIFRLSFDLKVLKSMLKNSYKIGLVVILSILYFRISIIELQLIKGASAVGIFSSAVKCIEMLTIIPGSIVIASFPSLVSDYKNSAEKFVKRTSSLLTGMFVLGIFLSLIFFFFGKYLIIILYGPKFIYSIGILKVLTWAIPFVFVNSMLTYILISSGNDRFNALCYFVATLESIITNFVFIQYFNIMGAAYAFLFTEVILSCSLFWIIINKGFISKYYFVRLNAR